MRYFLWFLLLQIVCVVIYTFPKRKGEKESLDGDCAQDDETVFRSQFGGGAAVTIVAIIDLVWAIILIGHWFAQEIK